MVTVTPVVWKLVSAPTVEITLRVINVRSVGMVTMVTQLMARVVRYVPVLFLFLETPLERATTTLLLVQIFTINTSYYSSSHVQYDIQLIDIVEWG